MIALGYKERDSVVERIDQIVRARRVEDPANTYSRAKFLREAVARALAELDAVSAPRVRSRRFEVAAPVQPV